MNPKNFGAKARRTAAVLCAAVLLGTSAQLGIPAAQADVSPANIVANQATSLTIHKYGGKNCTANETANNGEEVANFSKEGCAALPGVTFSVTPVLYKNELLDLSKPKDWEVLNNLNEADVLAKLNAATPDTTSFTKGTTQTLTKTDKNGVTTFTPKAGEYRLYLVKEETSETDVQTPAVPFLITLPYPKSGTGDWLYNVHVYPKNKLTGNVLRKDGVAPDTKVLDGTSHAASWWIQTPIWKVPDGNTYTEGWITDQLPSNVGVTSTSPAKVYLSAAQPTDETSALAAADYEVTGITGTPSAQSPAYGAKLKIALTSAGLAKLKDAQAVGKLLWVKLDTVVDDTTITTPANGVIINNVQSHFKDNKDNGDDDDTTPEDPDNPGNPDPDNPGGDNSGYEKYGTLTIQKFDSTAGDKAYNKETNSLKGAEFKVYETTDGACVAPSSSTVYLKSGTSDKVYTTDDSGLATIKLWVSNEKNVTSKDYCIQETKAPLGYVTPTGSDAVQKITFTADGTTTTAATKDWANKKTGLTNLIKLPMTGAAGKLLLTLVGAAIIAGAVFWYTSARRRTARDAR